MDQNIVFEGKTAAALSYITFVGLIIAYFMNSETKNPFASFHIRQSLGLTLTYFLFMIPLSSFNSWLVSGPFMLAFFALWIYGIVSAFQGQIKPLPIVGSFYQRVFSVNK